VLAQIIAYSPFYFDGNYPGGGARFYADVLPIEHVLAAVAITRFAHVARTPSLALGRASAALAFVPFGFAVRAGFDHAALRDREGGRPMFEPQRVEPLGSALVYFDTDHGLNLAYAPRPAWAPSRADPIEAVRFHGDALDRWTWESRGRPPAFRYQFQISSSGLAEVSLLPLSFELDAPLGIEGESLWPVLGQARGFAWPEHASGTCASGSRWLALRPADEHLPAVVSVSLPARWIAGRTLAPRIASIGSPKGKLSLVVDELETRSWETFTDRPEEQLNRPVCRDLPPETVPSSARSVRLLFQRNAGTPDGVLALDRLDVDSPKSH
jgi:hypothetical protein